jgi:hypothetical protein
MVCWLQVLACLKEDALARLMLGDGQGRWTGVGKPISSQFTSWKAYPSCLNPPGLSCLVRQVLRSFWIRSSGESSGRSSGGRVGHQLGRLGPLTGRRVFW